MIAYFDHASENGCGWAWGFVERVLPTGGVIILGGQLIPYRWIYRVSTKEQQEAWERDQC